MLDFTIRKNLAISTQPWRLALADKLAALQRFGVSTEAVFQYALEICRLTPIHELEQYLTNDLVHWNPDQARHQLMRMRHTCIDVIGEMSALIIPTIEHQCGVCDHTVRFERFIGQDLVVSVPFYI